MTSASEIIRILSVDDHPLIRAGVTALVGTQPDMTIVGEEIGRASCRERVFLSV